MFQIIVSSQEITTQQLTMEQVLNNINNKYITLKTNEVKYNNRLLKSTLEKMINAMKDLDSLFKTIYEQPFFGGSFYDDLKVGKPDEFDLDLLMVVPKLCQMHNSKICGCISVKPSNKPGFFWFKMKENFYPPFNRFIKDGYVQTDLVLNWLKGLVYNALAKIHSLDHTIHYFSESGPALTLRIIGDFGEMDVDLVPSFKFGSDFWPKEGFRKNPSQTRKDFFIVPKKTRGTSYNERFWRPSFQDQERELIGRRQRLKPALRLLKKMRNNLVHSSVSSYALKTIVLWDLDTGYFDWNATLTDTFIKLLEKYRDNLKEKQILYYWNKGSNLLDGIHHDTLMNHYYEISKKLNIIKREYMTNPLIVAKIILKEGTEEYVRFINENETANPMQNHLPAVDWHNFEPENSNLAQDNSSRGSFWLGVAGVVGAIAVIGFAYVNSNNNNNRRN